jgi:hypothetical protein
MTWLVSGAQVAAAAPAPSSQPATVTHVRLATTGAVFSASPVPVAPTITLSAVSGPPGTPVTITGSGFPAGEIVALYIDQPGPYLDVPGPRADAQGNILKAITMPGSNYDSTGRVKPAVAGPHSICGDTSYPNPQPIPAKACAEFQVEAVPSPTPTPVAGSPTPVAGGASQTSGASLPEVLAAVVIVLLVAAGAVWWLRRRK